MAGFTGSKGGRPAAGGMWLGPRPRSGPSIPRRATTPAPRNVTSSRPVTVTPRAPFISHYDPSRVVDLDKLKIVKDMRQSGSERGETQSGDGGELGPGSTSGAFRDVTRRAAVETPATGADGRGLIIAALAAALLLGG